MAVSDNRSQLATAVVTPGSRQVDVIVEDLSDRVRLMDAAESGAASVQDFRQRIQRHETELILEALRASAWNQTEAARRLNMPLRTMVRKIQSYGLRDRRST